MTYESFDDEIQTLATHRPPKSCESGDHRFRYIFKIDGGYLLCFECGEVKFEND
jgi:hypothetical protein